METEEKGNKIRLKETRQVITGLVQAGQHHGLSQDEGKNREAHQLLLSTLSPNLQWKTLL